MSTLNIQIDQAGRQFLLENKEKVVLIIPQDEDYLVACASFDPSFGDNNTVEFDDLIEYTSLQKSISDMDIIKMNAEEKNVSAGYVYTVDNTGFQGSTPMNPSKENVYGLLNKRYIDDNYNLTCGLGQKILINGSSDADYNPINVYGVPYNQTTYFETNSKVWIFVATGISSNMIIPSYMLAPESNILVQEANLQRIVSLGYYLEVDLKITSTIYFDNLTHMFQIGPLPE